MDTVTVGKRGQLVSVRGRREQESLKRRERNRIGGAWRVYSPKPWQPGPGVWSKTGPLRGGTGLRAANRSGFPSALPLKRSNNYMKCSE